MKICVRCALEMGCIKNRVGADFGNGHVYSGDLYQCRQCFGLYLHCNANPVQDPEYKFFTHYVTMRSGTVEDVSEDVRIKVLSALERRKNVPA